MNSFKVRQIVVSSAVLLPMAHYWPAYGAPALKLLWVKQNCQIKGEIRGITKAEASGPKVKGLHSPIDQCCFSLCCVFSDP